MTEPAGSERGGLSTDRLEALVDGVFAVVITLLILNLKVPQVSQQLSAAQASQELLHDLGQLLPTVLAYVISVVIAGVYWVGHHNQFGLIRHTDRVLLWINVLFIMCVVFIPFSAALLGAYPRQQVAVIVYGSNLIVIGLVLALHWRHATAGHRLVAPDLDPGLIRLAMRRILMGPCWYLAAVALSFLNTGVSIIIYVLVPILFIVPGRLDRHPEFRSGQRPDAPAEGSAHPDIPA
ncbi:MAG TPA: TMEM175 family protein [Chloroflexota bacterium]